MVYFGANIEPCLQVKVGSLLSQGKVALLYKEEGDDAVKKLKCVSMGRVVKLMVKSGSTVKPGDAVLEFSGGCSHPTIMKVNHRYCTYKCRPSKCSK